MEVTYLDFCTNELISLCFLPQLFQLSTVNFLQPPLCFLFVILDAEEDQSKHLLHIPIFSGANAVRWNPASQDEVLNYLLFFLLPFN